MYNTLYDRGGQPERKSCLQRYIAFTSYFNLLISLLALALGIYRAAKNHGVWNGSSFDWNSALISALLAAAGLLFVTSIVGILGSRKRNKCCLFIFHMFSMVLALAFLVIGFIFVGVTVYANDATNFKCTNDDNVQTFYWAQQGYDTAQPILCSDQCPCGLNNQQVIDGIHESSPTVQLYFKENGPTQVQNCDNYNQQFSNSSITQEIPWIQLMEESFQCTGICSKPNSVNAYFFSDINSGVPDSDTCIVKFQDFLQSYGTLVYLVGLITGFYLTFNAILSFCLCCKRKQEGLSLQERYAPY